MQNKTALQVAAHQGYQNIVILLLNAGADAAIQDEDGDSAYHYAAFGFDTRPISILRHVWRCKLTEALLPTARGVATGVYLSLIHI